MQQFLIYEIKVAIVMATFYMFYRLMLSREKLHRLNRCVLVGTVIASFLLPLCIITVHRSISVPTQLLLPQMDDTGFRVQFNGEEMENPFNWLTVIFAIYCAGIAAILMKVAIDIIKLRKLILKGEKHHDESGITLVVLDTNISTFSWMNYIFLSREDYGTGNNHIMEHERAHIRFGHAKELLCMEIISSLQWFNPAMWFLKSDLKSIYEYEADDAVLQSGANIKDYQYSLIRKAVSASGYSITNSFNHSILKNRITMMSKSKFPMRGLRALYIIPLICGALTVNAKTVFDYKGNDKASTIIIKLSENSEDVDVNGKTVSAAELPTEVLALSNSLKIEEALIDAEAGVNMSIIENVKMALRKASILKVSYLCSGKEKVTMRMSPAPGSEYYISPEKQMDGMPMEYFYNMKVNSENELLILHNNDVLYKGNIIDKEKELSEVVTRIISHHNTPKVFMLQCSDNTSYQAYNSTRSSIEKAFDSAREEYAQKIYNRPFSELDREERNAVRNEVQENVIELDLRTSLR